MASSPVARNSHSTRQAVTQASAVGASGAGYPVSDRAALGSATVSGTGGSLRASAVATPKASTMMRMRTPYGVARSDHDPSRVVADMTPETPRVTKHQRATVE